MAPVLLDEISILDELSQAQATVDKADRSLNGFAGRVSRAVDETTDGPTRKQLRTALFKNKSLSKFNRPVLAGQLASMTDWSETLSKCGVPALVAMAAEASTLTSAGKSAEGLRDKAQKKNRDFRDVGRRKQFIDKVNAARKESHGALAKLPFENPSLSQDFADVFFYRETPQDNEETIDQVKASIDEIESQLAERKTLLKQLEDDAAAEAKAAEERKALESSANDLEAQAKELLAKAAALKAQLKK